MAKALTPYAPPPSGSGGEQQAAAPLAFGPTELEQLYNALITGPGLVEHAPDFLLADTCKDEAGTTESEVACGAYPFATQGDAVSPSAGVAFSANLTTNRVLLHQLDEDALILRTLPVYEGYTPTKYPQLTGFEYQRQFFYCLYGWEDAAADRLGMGVFDPAGFAEIDTSSAAGPTLITLTGAPDTALVDGEYVTIAGHSDPNVNGCFQITLASPTTFTISPTSAGGTGGHIYCRRLPYALNGGSAHVLGFRGIAQHRGGTILGFGYRDEVDPEEAAMLRWCQYVDPMIWVPDDTIDTSAGGAIVGTPGLPVIGCAQSGQYTIVGKTQEVYALDGDYDAEFYVGRSLGVHGPVATPGIISIGTAAVWMSNEGFAISEEGSLVRLLGTDRDRRRLKTYLDLGSTWGVHDVRRQRVGMLMRPKVDAAGNPLSLGYPSQIWWWDYARNALYVQDLPGIAWSLGYLRGAGASLPGPTGTLVIDAVSAEDATSFQLNFTPGDTSPGVTYQFYYREHGTTTWFALGAVNVGATSVSVTGLDVSTVYDVKGHQVRNGQTDGDVETDSYATTTSGILNAPTVYRATEVYVGGYVEPPTHWQLTANFNPNYDAGVTAKLYASTTNTPATATVIGTAAASAGAITDPTIRAAGDSIYYWVTFTNSYGESAKGAAAGNPQVAGSLPT
jgi:hypothetical protein